MTAPDRRMAPVSAVGSAPVAPDPGPFVSWPMESGGPYESVITALFDHTNLNWNLKDPATWKQKPHKIEDPVIVTGGIIGVLPVRSPQVAPCASVPSSDGSTLLTAIQLKTRLKAEVGIVYDGACANEVGILAYSNHMGVDIRAEFGTKLIAPMSGYVLYDAPDPTSLDAKVNHALAICASYMPAKKGDGKECAGWRVRLLHLSSYWDGAAVQYAVDLFGNSIRECGECPHQGEFVERGSFVGYSGNFGAGSYGGVPVHLHLDVIDPNGVVRDVYGWPDTGSAVSDPLGPYSNQPLWLRETGPEALEVIQVGAGFANACALRRNGQVWCWGAAGLFANGGADPILLPAEGHRFRQIAVGTDVACALEAPSNETWCWGRGVLGDGNLPRFIPAVVQIGHRFDVLIAGNGRICGIRDGGELWCWGARFEPLSAAPDLPPPVITYDVVPTRVFASLDLRVRNAAAGSGQMCAVRDADGQLVCWGSNAQGEAGARPPNFQPVPHELTLPVGAEVLRIVAGQGATCALARGGAVYCWGWNWTGQLGDGTTIDHSDPAPVRAPGLAFDRFSEYGLAASHFCALAPLTPTAWCWGFGDQGQLGRGDFVSQYEPKAVPMATTWQQISVGGNFTCALASSRVWCWGDNYSGQVGTRPEGSREPEPREVVLPKP